MILRRLSVRFCLVIALAACGEKEGGDMSGSGGSVAGHSGAGGDTQGSTGGSGGISKPAGGTGGGAVTGGTGGTVAGGTGGTVAGGGTGGTMPVAAFRSNTPAAEFKETSSGTGLKLLSSNYVQSKPLNTVYTYWFGEVQNISNQVKCLIGMSVGMRSASGPLVTFDLYVTGSPYKSGTLPVTTDCLAPGEHGGAWSIETGGTLFNPSNVRTVEYSFDPFEGGSVSVVHPNRPMMNDFKVVTHPQFGGQAVSGRLVAKGTIHNIGLSVFAINAQGLIVEELSDTHLDTLFSGATWNVETLPADEPFSQFLAFESFIDGPKGALAVLPDSALTRRLNRMFRLNERKVSLREGETTYGSGDSVLRIEH